MKTKKLFLFLFIGILLTVFSNVLTGCKREGEQIQLKSKKKETALDPERQNPMKQKVLPIRRKNLPRKFRIRKKSILRFLKGQKSAI
jgi:hypothetical protein